MQLSGSNTTQWFPLVVQDVDDKLSEMHVMEKGVECDTCHNSCIADI